MPARQLQRRKVTATNVLVFFELQRRSAICALERLNEFMMLPVRHRGSLYKTFLVKHADVEFG